VTNYWGGSSRATTHLLDALHYHGLLRIAGRDAGVRLYAVRQPAARPRDLAERRSRIDAIVDILVSKYAPLPAASLSGLVGRLRYGIPQWRGELRAALGRATARLQQARVDGITWYWPAGTRAAADENPAEVHLLAPFDPVVWDRRRFELLWGWRYRFEAYTPVSKRTLGYYALPMLWCERVVGWANVSLKSGALQVECGYVEGHAPRERGFQRDLDVELERMRMFLSASGSKEPSPEARSLKPQSPKAQSPVPQRPEPEPQAQSGIRYRPERTRP
jgi:hypothetical protein